MTAPVDLTVLRLRETVTVAAPPEAVWARVSDITRMGDASPACTACTWDDPATGMAEGAWFTGTNTAGEHSYDTRCQIDSFEDGHSFHFTNHGLEGNAPSSRWGYEVAPADGGTELSETWEILPGFVEHIETNYPDVDVAAIAAERKDFAKAGIDATLAALKAELES
jgi:carbon monoxide dehydrogenase subunit G